MGNHVIHTGRPEEIEDFWKMIGPMCASRQVEKELGAKIYDSEQTNWFLCVDGSQLIGFAAVTNKGRVAHFHSCYVLPKYRWQGVSYALDAARLDYAHSLRHVKKYKRTVRTSQERRIQSMERGGWVVHRKIGTFSRLIMEVNHGE